MSDILLSPVDQMRIDIKRQLALTSLEDSGVLMLDGHFDLGNGYCSTSYLNPHALLDRPGVILRLAQDLLEVLALFPTGGSDPGSVVRKTQVVSGPATGGSLLGFVLAAFLDGATKKGKNVYFAPMHKIDGKLVMRDHYRQIVRGKRVLLVDDVLNTGLTFFSASKLIQESGGEVIATTQLYDRMSAVYKLTVPNIPLAEYRLEQDLVRTEQCPQCKFGIPFTKF